MAQAHGKVIAGTSSGVCCGVSYGSLVGCYWEDRVGPPPNYRLVGVGCEFVDLLHTPAVRLAHLYYLWGTYFVVLPVSIVVSVISTVVIIISIFIFPIVVVVSASTFIVVRVLRVPIALVLAKPLVWLPTLRCGSILRTGVVGRFKRLYSHWSIVCALEWQIGQCTHMLHLKAECPGLR